MSFFISTTKVNYFFLKMFFFINEYASYFKNYFLYTQKIFRYFMYIKILKKYLKHLKKNILALNAGHNLLSNFFSKKKLKRCLK